MLSIRLVVAAFAAAALGLIPVPGIELGSRVAHAQDQSNAVRPEIGKPLQAARDLMKAQKHREALGKIAEADNVPGKTANENYLINYMRFSAASAAGDADTAAKARDVVLASGNVPAAAQAKLVEAMVGVYYKSKEYAKAIQLASRHLRDNGGNAQIRQLLAQAYYLNNEFAKAATEMQSMVQAEVQAGKTPSETQLQLLATSYNRTKDNAGYASALEKLVTYYPKREYWVDLLGRVQRKSGYASRLDIDVFRLRFATGNVKTTADFMEMSQLALQAGSSAEAKKIVDQAYAAGVLGTGAEAERHKRLRDLATKSVTEAQQSLAQRETEAAAAKDGGPLVSVGFETVMAGRYDKGIHLMEQGIKKGNLKYPDDAKLHLGAAYFLAGNKSRAVEVFKTVRGTDGSADLARLWVLHSARS